jgi:uncharacterized membrane protein YkoI
LFGLLPFSLGTGVSSEMQRSLALAVIGLTLSRASFLGSINFLERHMKFVIRITFASAVLVAASTTLLAQASAGATGGRGVTASVQANAAITVTEAKPGLLKRAKVTPDAAMAKAQAKVPTGKLDTAEIEEEDGKLIYSLVYKIAGKTGVEEVAVDAMTGKVLSVEHETSEDIAKEKKADSVAAAKAKAKAAAARGRGGE